MCAAGTELDLFEANNWAMQTAVHTQVGGSYGSGNCDRNGCFQRVGGPQSPPDQQNKYGPGKEIDSMRPFRVSATVERRGSHTVHNIAHALLLQPVHSYCSLCTLLTEATLITE